MPKRKFDEEELYYFISDERAPLYDASREGHLEIVKCLIENGADVNAKDGIC